MMLEYLGYVFLVILALVVLFIVGLFVASLPDIARYLKIRAM